MKKQTITYEPFNLHDEKVRMALADKWLYDMSCDYMDMAKPIAFHRNANGVWFVCLARMSYDESPTLEWWTADELMSRWGFLESNTPCGKAVVKECDQCSE